MSGAEGDLSDCRRVVDDRRGAFCGAREGGDDKIPAWLSEAAEPGRKH